MKRHNIYLSGEEIDIEFVKIKGNNLNLRWFDKCILVWSDNDNKNPTPKALLEIIEEALKIKNVKKKRGEA
jgi:hypothetical protein